MRILINDSSIPNKLRLGHNGACNCMSLFSSTFFRYRAYTVNQYLAGLSTIMIGYLWFLYHNREVSYRSALNLTVSKRQNALYEKRGFDLQKWENLIEEANALRKEIKNVADEYDVEWNELKDESTEEVHDALREERRKAKRGRKDNDDDEDDHDDGKKNGKDAKKKND